MRLVLIKGIYGRGLRSKNLLIHSPYIGMNSTAFMTFVKPCSFLGFFVFVSLGFFSDLRQQPHVVGQLAEDGLVAWRVGWRSSMQHPS